MRRKMIAVKMMICWIFFGGWVWVEKKEIESSQPS